MQLKAVFDTNIFVSALFNRNKTSLTQPFRGSSSNRPQDIPLPPDSMPLLRAGRLLKQWRYVSIWSSTLSLCTGSVRVGPAKQEFWSVWDRAGRRLWGRTRMIPCCVDLTPGRVLVDDADVKIEIKLHENPGFEVVTPDGDAYTWTRKQIVRANGSVSIGSITLPVQATALIDDNAGYHARRTNWKWCGGSGVAVDGRNVAWNVLIGLNDPTENTLWIDGVPQSLGAVRFAPDLSSVSFAEGGALRFHAEAVRRRHDNMVFIRSAYSQPFGGFSGNLPGNIELREGYGVMERHSAIW